VVAVVEPQELAQWLRRVPVLEAFARVEVPAVDAWALAAIWLGHAIARPGLGPEQVIAALDAIGVSAAAGIEPWAFEQLVRPQGLLAFYEDEEACRVVTAGRAGKGSGASKRGVESGIVEALGGAEGIERLGEIERRLRLG
jgi:hypothetical protein